LLFEINITCLHGSVSVKRLMFFIALMHMINYFNCALTR